MRLFFILMLTATYVLPASAQSVIPYQGTLETNGQKISQQGLRMAFALYTDTGDLVAAEPEAAPAEGQQWKSWAADGNVPADDAALVSVDISNGRFSVNLGENRAGSPQVALPDTVFTAGELSLVIWIKNDRGIHRLPPQKLQTVPHAVTAKRATNFSVTGVLTAAAANIEGHMSAESAETQRDLVVGEHLSVADSLTVGGVKMPPPGMVAAFYRNGCPPGWRDLATATGTWNFGDGNIRVSPIGGRFVRVAANAGERLRLETGTTYQSYNVQRCHRAAGCLNDGWSAYVHQRRVRLYNTDSGTFTFDPPRGNTQTQERTSSEFRPRNIRLLHCVRLP